MAAKSLICLMLSVLLIAGCAIEQPTGPANAKASQCAMIGFPQNERIDAWSVDKFAGMYVNNTDRLTIRRDAHRLLVEGWNLGTRQLTAESVESWTWHDGCGVRYEFVLPPDGPGGWLKIISPDGASTDWHR